MKILFYRVILFFILILVENSYAQNDTGIAVYSKLYVEKESTAKSLISRRLKSMESKFKELKFELSFSNEESIFKIKENLSLIDDRDLILVSTVGGSKGIFYMYLPEGVVLNKKESFGQEFIVKKSLKSYKWNLINESKKIGNYLCYKATTFYIVKNSKGIFKHPVEVWYTPEIQVGFGPIGYGGLPGLIIELKVLDFKYQMEKITLNPKKGVVIKKPIKGKLVTEEEFTNIGREAMGNFKSRISN